MRTIVLLTWILGACGTSRSLPDSADIKPVFSDGAVVPSDADLPDEFAKEVKTASDSCSITGCAIALPTTPVQGSTDIRTATRLFVAEQLGVGVDSIIEFPRQCGGSQFASCATIFSHDLYKGDGCRGMALEPLADRVEKNAASVEMVDWNSNVSSTKPVVTIAGQQANELFGIAYFFERTTCGL